MFLLVQYVLNVQYCAHVGPMIGAAEAVVKPRGYKRHDARALHVRPWIARLK